MNSKSGEHRERISCPHCSYVQWGVVKHSNPPTYVHICKNCGYTILKSEWKRVPVKEYIPVAKRQTVNTIHPTAVIGKNVELGTGNYIGPHCVIGYPAEWKSKWGTDPGKVVIGNDNIITGLVTIDAGGTGITHIGHGCFIMKHAHIGHDSIIEDFVTISCGAKIGGHTHIMEGATVGLNASIHQKQIIGAWSMIGMGAVIPKKVLIQPFNKYAGNPVRLLGVNLKMMDSGSLSEEEIKETIKRYDELISINTRSL